MFARLSTWLDDRTSYRKLVSALLIEHIPGGAKWRYVWGSCLAFVFAVQLITGILLMTSYSAGDSTAWSSVYYIQYQMDFGWFIRGLHHFGSQTMVVLLALHMLQVVIAGAHLSPREINWWLGMGLMGLVLALSLTGYLLPWDQKGYWATQVATNIAGDMPVVGPWMKQVIVGGPEYGHQTLTRFYALHVGILPLLLIVLMIAHIAIFRKHGVTTPKGVKGDGWFWPDQAFRDLLVSLIIFGIMIALVLYGHGHTTTPAEDKWSYDYWAHAGRAGLGANLDSPADPSNAYPARPEWYFLPLFQLIKYFPPHLKIIGTVVIPNGVMALLFLLPLLGYGRMRTFGHIIGVLVVTGVLTGAASLTLLAVADDTVLLLARAALTRLALYAVPLIAVVLLLLLSVLAILPRGGFRSTVRTLGMVVLLAMLGATGALTYWSMETEKRYLEHARSGSTEPFDDVKIPKPIVEWIDKDLKNMDENQVKVEKSATEAAEKFNEELEQAGKLAKASVNAAGRGVPAAGGISMLRRDPAIEGPKLFEKNCAACHTHGKDFKVDTPTAPDLSGFGTEEWNLRFLTDPGHKDFFGRFDAARKEDLKMVDAIKENFPFSALTPEEQAKLVPQEKEDLEKEKNDLKTLARWLASHPRNTSKDSEEAWFKEALDLFFLDSKKTRGCATCHTYEGKGGRSGPDLTGYGDATWVRTMIMMPNHPSRYGMKNTMPAFRDMEGPASEVTKQELARIKEMHMAQFAGDEAKQEKMKKAIEQSSKVIHMNDVERELIIRWLLKDPNVVFGGGPIAPSPGKP